MAKKGPTELKQSVIDQFWSIYEVEGTIQALSWLESLKYYEEYCQNDIDHLSSIISTLQI